MADERADTAARRRRRGSLLLGGVAAFALLGDATEARCEKMMRCGSRVVDLGMAEAEVRAACGEPVDVSRHVVTRAHETSSSAPTTDQGDQTRRERDVLAVSVDVDEWVYDFGPNRLTQRLTFENGTLVRITTDRRR